MMEKLTVVIPVYNEAGAIEEVVRSFYEKVVHSATLEAGLIIAEDGSSDGTKEILQRLKKEIPFTLISDTKRKGYTKAFKDAMRLPVTEWVFFSDSDGQHEPGDVLKMFSARGDFDIVSGYKVSRKDPMHRVLLSVVYNSIIAMFFGLRLRDIDSGFKLMKKKMIDDVLPEVTEFDTCVMSEFILKAYLKGYKIKEVPITHYARKCGSTSIFKPQKLPRIIFGILRNLWRIKLKHSAKNKQ